MQGRQKLDTGIDRAESQLRVDDFGDHHRAGTAIALGASFLAADAAQVFAQELQQAARRVGDFDRLRFAIEQETDATH